MSDPFAPRLKFDVGYKLNRPLGTAFTESGLGHTLSLGTTFHASPEDGYELRLSRRWLNTDGKLVDTASTTIPGDHRAWMLTFGSRNRGAIFFDDDRNYRGAFVTSRHASIGVEESSYGGNTVGEELGEPTRTVESSDKGLLLSRGGGFGVEYQPFDSRWGTVQAGIGYDFEVAYFGKKDEHNRLRMVLNLLDVRLGANDIQDNTSPHADTLRLTLFLSDWAHGLAHRYLTAAVLNQPQEDLEQLNQALAPTGTGDEIQDPGVMEHVRFFQGALTFMNAVQSGSSMNLALRSGRDRFWVYPLADIGSGVFSLFAVPGSSGEGAAASDFMHAARKIMPRLFDVTSVNQTERIRNAELTSYALGTSAVIIGGAMDNGDASSAFLAGGVGLLAGIAASPAGRRLVENMDILLLPLDYYSSGDRSGNRSGIMLHNDWQEWLYSEASLRTHVATGENLESRISEDERFDGTELPTDVVATLGANHLFADTVRLGAGVDAVKSFGIPDEPGALGVSGGVDIVIPFLGKFGLTLGGRYALHKRFGGGAAHTASLLVGAHME